MTAPADLIVRHARPFGVEAADTLAVCDARVVAGLEPELLARRGSHTRVIDARGATVTPGLCDAHVHLVGWARAFGELTLEPAWSLERVLDAVRAYALAHARTPVLVGRGWANEAWTAAPDRARLDAVCGDRPVLLHSKDFHALWVNTAALEQAGVSAATADPAGGRFERDAGGRPTGVVREHAVRAFAGLLAAAEPPEPGVALAEAVRRLHAEGVTSVHDFEGAAEAGLLRRVCARDGDTPLRVLMHLAHVDLDAALADGRPSGDGDAWFRRGAVKLFADGTLGSRTAAMLEPYVDGGADPAGRGMDLLPAAELAAIARRAIHGRLSVAVHAIGDRAVRHTLDAFESAPEAERRALALPPRIEHAQLVQPSDQPRFGRLGVAASMQPSHEVSDRALARARWTPWLEHAYPWAALARAGATLAFGSDAPVEPPSVALGLHAAVTRRAPGEPETAVDGRAQRVTLAAALAAYTRGPAILAGDPALGRFDAGAGGDLVVWDRDLFAAEVDELASARPVMTVVGGQIVHERAGAREAA